MRSWRNEAADRLERFCGLNPEALSMLRLPGAKQPSFWKNHAAQEKAMPSKSPRQAKTMRAAAHNPKFAKKVGIPQSVAQEFVLADKKAGTTGGPMKGKTKR